MRKNTACFGRYRGKQLITYREPTVTDIIDEPEQEILDLVERNDLTLHYDSHYVRATQ